MEEAQRLERQKSCELAGESHQAVMNFHSARNDRMEACINALRGKIYGESELRAFREAGRVPVSINKAVAPFRTVMGALAQSMFDSAFLPRSEGECEKLAEALSKLAIFEEKRCDDLSQNAQAAQMAFAVGRGYRLCWVESGLVDGPRVRSMELNPFAVYFDPDSREVISRTDADFVDVVHWLSPEEIAARYPRAAREIMEKAPGKGRTLGTEFESYDKSADRRHETACESCGKRKVIERYYKVRRTRSYAASAETGELAEIGPEDAQFLGAPAMRKQEEELWLAVWAPELCAEFLYNGEFNAQPRDPDTGKIIWPVVELVSDSMMGEIDGFMEFIRDPVKIISVLYTQLIEAAKHSSSAYLMNPAAYVSREEADRAKRLGPYSNQRFEVMPGMHGEAMKPMEQNGVSSATVQAINYVEPLFTEETSATKALQGVGEGSGTAASLNQQRIEQSSVQLNSFFGYYKRYLRQMLKLRYAYWREHYTEEMTFRILVPPERRRSELVTLNQPAAAIGWNGLPNGEVYKINDIGAAEFDVAVSDSFLSPTFMQRQQKLVEGLLQNQALMANPSIAPVLAEWCLRVSDAPTEIKEQLKQNMLRQQEQEAMMAQQQQQVQMQMPRGMTA